MDITSACFDHIITINEIEYHKALYGPFNVIMMKTNDYRNGYINATKLCEKWGKVFNDWIELVESKELLEESSDLLYSVSQKDGILSGTYIHPKLIPHIGMWINPKFKFEISHIYNRSLGDSKKNISTLLDHINLSNANIFDFKYYKSCNCN